MDYMILLPDTETVIITTTTTTVISGFLGFHELGGLELGDYEITSCIADNVQMIEAQT